MTTKIATNTIFEVSFLTLSFLYFYIDIIKDSHNLILSALMIGMCVAYAAYEYFNKNMFRSFVLLSMSLNFLLLEFVNNI